MELDETKDDYKKPGYDGRLYYFEVIGGYLKAIANATLEKNYTLWFRSIRGLYVVICPHIPKRNEIKKQIEETQKKLNLYLDNEEYYKFSRFYNFRIDKILSDLTETIYLNAKHLLVPLGESDDEEDLEGYDNV